jgi:hypothetical protein
MATNPYFKEYIGEQTLLDDLVVETIKTMGRDMIYIPREYLNRDIIFGEDPISRFTDAYTIEMYIQNVTAFGGQMNIINKFGINITDRVTLQVSKTRFEQEIYTKNTSIRTPREGDLIYFPFNKSIFEINYVEDKLPFFQFGTLNVYTLTCELFTYSYETIETGVTEIDDVEEKRKYNMLSFTLSSGPVTGTTVLRRGDLVFQVLGVTGNGATFANATAQGVIVEYTGNTTYIKGVTGTFVSGSSGTQSIKNKENGTEYYLLDVNETNVNLSVDPISGVGEIENDVYADEADNTLNFSRDNPFSEECS